MSTDWHGRADHPLTSSPDDCDVCGRSAITRRIVEVGDTGNWRHVWLCPSHNERSQYGRLTIHDQTIGAPAPISRG